MKKIILFCQFILLSLRLFSQDKDAYTDSAQFFLNNPAHANCLKCRFQDSAIYFLNNQDFTNVSAVLERSWKIKNDTDWFTPIYLAKANWQIGKYDEVKNLLTFGLHILEKNGDTNNYGYVVPLFLLGNYYYLQDNDLAKAQNVFKRVIRLREANDLLYDPEYFLCKNSIGDIFRKIDMRDSAIKIYSELESKFKNVDFNDKRSLYFVPYVCPVLESFADMYKEDGRFNLSESYHLRCLSLIEKAYGIDDETYLNVKSRLAFLYLEMGETEKTKQTFLECLDITKTLYGVSNRRYLNFQADLSLCYMKDSLEKARDLLKCTLLTQIQILGSKDEDYLSTLQMFSKVDSLVNDYSNEFFRGWHNELDLDYNSALRHYNNAKNNLENKKLLDSNYIKVLINIGNCLQNIGEIDSSVITFHQALSVEKRKLNFDVNNHYFFIVGKILELFTVQKENDRILTFCSDEMSFIEKKFGKQNDIYLTLLMHYVDYQFMYGKEYNEELIKNAISIFKNSHAGRVKINNQFLPKYSYASLLCKLGVCYQDKRDFHTSDSLYSQALTEFANGGEDSSYEYIDCVASKAKLNQDIGNFQVSSELYMAALILVQNNKDSSLSLPKFSSLFKILSGLSGLATEKGDKETALGYFSSLKNIFNDSPQYRSNVNFPIFLINLATAYYKFGSIDSAKHTLLYARKIEDSFFKNSQWLVAATLFTLSNLYLNTNVIDSAKFFAFESLNIEKQLFPEKSMHHARIISHLSTIYLKEGNLEEAKATALEAMDVTKSIFGENHFELADRFLSVACLYIISHQYDSAVFFLDKVMRINEKNFKKNFKGLQQNYQLNYSQKYQYQYQVIKDLCFEALIDTSIYLRTFHSKFNTLLYLNELNYKNLGTRKNFLSANVGDIGRLLKSEDIAIEFVDKRKGDTLSLGAIVMKDSKYSEFLFNFWIEKKYQDSFGGQEMYNDNKDNLYYVNDYVISKELKLLCEGKKNIYISPTSLFYRVNFSAIPFDNNITFGEKYNVHIVNSTADIFSCKPTYIDKKTIQEAVIYGGVEYNKATYTLPKVRHIENQIGYLQIADIASRSSTTKFSYLPGSEKESRNIHDFCKANEMFSILISGESATEESFKSLSGKREPYILHIATHGFFFPDPQREKQVEFLPPFKLEERINVFKWSDDPLLRSGLIFAGANKTWGKTDYVIDSTEDGILTSYEISNLDLSNCQLVVLSACETGLGDIKGSEGVFGLQRAFKMAGVKNIIMSLWKVPDKETQELMTLFYNYCFSGKSVHDALQSAQSDMKKKYPPYYWAAFKLLE